MSYLGCVLHMIPENMDTPSHLAPHSKRRAVPVEDGPLSLAILHISLP